MKTLKPVHIVAIIVWLLPAIYLMWVYSSLPQIVPVHYGLAGKADRFGHRSEIAVLTAIMMAVTAGVYLLITFLPAIDPKKSAAASEGTFEKVGIGLVFFMTIIVMVIIYGTVNGGLKFERIILPLMGLFFAYLGNLMYSIKPNYFAGVRIPWTLEDEGNWRATHQLTGKLWVAGGLIMALLTLVLPFIIGFIVFMVTMLIICIIPIVYSYRYFKNHQSKIN